MISLRTIIAVPLIAVYLTYTLQLHVLLPALNDPKAIKAGLLKAFFFIFRPPLGEITGPVKIRFGEAKKFERKIVAVGDLHGDIGNARTVLKFAGVVDDEGNWNKEGGVDFFVQTGDIIDRGPDTIDLFAWMDQLRGQAKKEGAVVLSHLGNHEWMNAIGDWRYVYPSELETFGSVEARQEYISTGPIGKTWAKNYTTTSRLPLHASLGPPNTPFPPKDHEHYTTSDLELEKYYDPKEALTHSAVSFVHGGLSPTYPELTPFPSRINEIAEGLLKKVQHRKQPPPHPPHPYPGLPASATHEEHGLLDSNGPLWYRGWALENEEQVCKDVDTVLAKTGTRRMIMGHTPDFKNIVSRCNGKVIIIDTGISHAYGGVLSALEIHYTLTPIATEKSDAKGHGIYAGKGYTQKWIEKEVVTALYQDKREVLVEDEREVIGEYRL